MSEYYGPTSFSELEELVEAREEANRIMSLGSVFSMLANNIIMDDEIEDKSGALSDLVSEYSERLNQKTKEREGSGGEPGEEPGGEPPTSIQKAIQNLIDTVKASPKKSESDGEHPAGHYLVVEDPQKTSTWHLRVRNASGDLDHNLMGAAWAALHGGYRGNKYAGPGSQEALAKLKALYKQEGMEMPSEKKETGFALFKDKRGRYNWFARYSNKYLDDDWPQEIIAEESHLNFINEVKSGNYDYPELWLHHIEGTAWGKATWVGYDNGFALAAGYIFPEHEDLAKSLLGRNDLLLSHGMPRESIVRDAENPNIIIRHQTKEISPLPAARAANKLTGFIILEDDMEQKGFSSEDRTILLDMGIPEASLVRLEESNKAIRAIADALDLPSKQKSAQEEPEVQEEDEVEIEVEIEDEAAEAGVVDEETIDAIVQSIKALNEKIDALADHVKSVSETQEKMVGESTKAARMSILGSVIGSEAARIDGRSSLAKSSPNETEPNAGGPFWRKEGWTHGN